MVKFAPTQLGAAARRVFSARRPVQEDRGTRAPSRSKRFRSRRNSTTSCSSSFASSSPATSDHFTSTCEPLTTGAGFARGMQANRVQEEADDDREEDDREPR